MKYKYRTVVLSLDVVEDASWEDAVDEAVDISRDLRIPVALMVRGINRATVQPDTCATMATALKEGK